MNPPQFSLTHVLETLTGGTQRQTLEHFLASEKGDYYRRLRADRAAFVIDAFLDATGEAGGACDKSVRDLLADLLHLCDREGHDADALVTTARNHWLIER